MASPMNTYDPTHPHEPDVPPVIAPDGHCRICRLMVEREADRAVIRKLREGDLPGWDDKGKWWWWGPDEDGIAKYKGEALTDAEVASLERAVVVP